MCYEPNWGERWLMLYKNPNPNGDAVEMTLKRVKNTHSADGHGAKWIWLESLICGSVAQNGWCLGGRWLVLSLVFQGAVSAALRLHCQLEFFNQVRQCGEERAQNPAWKQPRCLLHKDSTDICDSLFLTGNCRHKCSFMDVSCSTSVVISVWTHIWHP